jgi:hypothetical protein
MHSLRTHPYSKDSLPLHTVKNFKKSFREETMGIRNFRAQSIKEILEKNRMHENFPSSVGKMLVHKEQSYRWQEFGDMKGEGEVVVVAA